MQKEITIKKSDIRNFIKSNYISEKYSDGSVELIESVEQMPARNLIKLIQDDVYALCKFLESQGIIIK